MDQELSVESGLRRRRKSRQPVDQSRSRRQKMRTAFFVLSGLAGFVLAAASLAIGIVLDSETLPFGLWSAMLLVIGASLAVATSHGVSALYREVRRRNGN